MALQPTEPAQAAAAADLMPPHRQTDMLSQQGSVKCWLQSASASVQGLGHPCILHVDASIRAAGEPRHLGRADRPALWAERKGAGGYPHDLVVVHVHAADGGIAHSGVQQRPQLLQQLGHRSFPRHPHLVLPLHLCPRAVPRHLQPPLPEAWQHSAGSEVVNINHA